MRVLVVEDEAKVARFIRRGLQEERFAVDVAREGDEALLLAESAPYDLIVLDLMLPARSGFEVLKELRARGQDVPVLVLTARDSIRDKVTSLDMGCDDYLTKPFAFAELLARIRSLLRRSHGHSSPKVNIGGLTLDPVARRVALDGRAIELTNKEYALLEYFMRNPNRVLTRTMISEHVWDYRFDCESNVIDVYMALLRKKVDPDRKLFHTVRGTGYMMRWGG
ncbi:MAG: response regulator transcription factor [Candidatus Methylomirabilales bacterium]